MSELKRPISDEEEEEDEWIGPKPEEAFVAPPKKKVKGKFIL